MRKLTRAPVAAFLLAPCLFLLAGGCKRGSEASPSQQPAAGAAGPALRLSLIPTTDPGKLLRQSQPLVQYLEAKLGTKVDLTVPTQYAAVVEAIANDQVDIAYLGGFTYVQASRRAGVLPLVQRDRDQNFHSLFITQPDQPFAQLSDVKGHSLAFGDVNSTSGHLMPEYFLREAGVDAGTIGKAIYTGGHDATALAVAHRKVDVGALDEAVYQRMIQEKKLDPGQLKVFVTSPPFFDYVWVARKGLDRRLADAFAAAFLELDANKPEHAPLLEILSAKKYVRADDKNYDKLRQAAQAAGLLK